MELLDPLSYIPRELLILVVSFLGNATIFSLSVTSKSLFEWRRLITYSEHFLHDILCDAASNGYIDVFRWLVPKPEPHMPFMYIRQHAAINGHIEILKYIHEGEDNLFRKDNIIDYAVAGGQISTVKWLHENGFTWDKWACYRAAEYGYINILRYLHENGCSWDSNVCTVAAKYGRIDILQYLHENGCPCIEEGVSIL